MLETEWKCILDESTYTELEKMFDWDFVKEQTNNYYTDSKGELKKHGMTLRVREIDGLKKIQIKAHKNSGSALQISEETEYDTDTVPDFFSAEEAEKMTGFPLPLSCIGSLTTLRHSLMYTYGVEICLDKNDYLGCTDYEIEIEYTKEIPSELMRKLRAVGVEFNTVAVGKYSRFMTRLISTLKIK